MGIIGRVKRGARKLARPKAKERWVVWVHPKPGGKGDAYKGDDYMYVYASKEAAQKGAAKLRASGHYRKVEPPYKDK